MTHSMTFDAIAEDLPGAKWRARWDACWPEYRAWFEARGGASGPSRQACEAALAEHMPELVPVHRDLTRLAGGGDLAARFLSTWCPPAYLGGCSLAALSDGDDTRLIRNYDLSPDLNEGFLLRSAWTGTPVMGMVEFLWGLSDGINEHGLSVALAFGGTERVGQGFGICTILRYLLETCRDVPQALDVLDRVPSHMDYNLVLADAEGRVQSVEVHAGGGIVLRPGAVATNHQLDRPLPLKAEFTRTVERLAALTRVTRKDEGDAAVAAFGRAPLYQTDFAGGFGTLFTAEYRPGTRAMRLIWPDIEMAQSLHAFDETSVTVTFGDAPRTEVPLEDLVAFVPDSRRDRARRWLDEARAGRMDWAAFGALFVPDAARP
ncbi:hypothetical protein ILP92_12850 [Maribius pontilimi]|uniref:Peptidase C45 hydrolase domain-containing protein n=1 Tax=Palleronia pontilimi TaxID=1964209 RepID=A0A934MD90_9RHOB|nr:C45 family peptidase [Palleronia pontilimi]MBJ3763638.1 hypothetical protein [Palleronia pontilimi]